MTPVITKSDITNYPVITKCFWSVCCVIKANEFGYNESSLITKLN